MNHGCLKRMSSSTQELFFIWFVLLVYVFLFYGICKLTTGFYSWPRLLLPNAWLFLASLLWIRRKSTTYFAIKHIQNTKELFVLGTGSVILMVFLNQYPVKESHHAVIPHLLLKFIFLAAIASICEEVFFRGIMLNSLKKYFNNGIISLLLTSVIFAYLHLSQGTVVFMQMFILSVILCRYTLVSKNIYGASVIHLCWNTVYYNQFILGLSQKLIFTCCAVMTFTVFVYILFSAEKHEKNH